MKLLLVQTSFLGDVILSTPVIAALRAIYPGAEIWMLTTPLAADLVKRDPELTGVLTLDKADADRGLNGFRRFVAELKKHNFEIAYALGRSWRTALLLSLAKIPERIGFKDAKGSFLYHRTLARNMREHDVLRNLSICADRLDRSALNSTLRLFAPKLDELSPELVRQLTEFENYVIVVPGSVWKTKRWHSEGFQRLLEHLRATGQKVVVVGSKAEVSIAEEVCQEAEVLNLVGRTTIAELTYLVKHAKLVVCNDSMVLHLASAFKIPTVTIFCATSPLFGFGPWQNKAKVMERQDLLCRPCRRHGSSFCPNGTEECMRGIDSVKVIEQVEKLLGR